MQGRVLLHLIELRRATGEYDLAVEHGAALDALLARSGNAPQSRLDEATRNLESANLFNRLQYPKFRSRTDR